MSKEKVILIEFNELVPKLMDKFISQNHLPFFSKLRQASRVYTTDAQAEGEDLNPWVQWVTVHSGLDLDEHNIKFLSDGCKLEKPSVWDIVSENGMPVLVGGSMNGRYDKPLNGYLIPDPWSSGLTCYPAKEFDTFYNYVRSAVQEHTNKDAELSVSSVQFVKWMLSHGLSFDTLRKVVVQLVGERFGRGGWKKAVILDQFLWDVFLKYYRKKKPRLATYFANSTAHYQHKYWRCMEPEIFKEKPTDEEYREYKDAILYGYKQMDEIIGKFLNLADKDTTLIFCTGLGQQPYFGHEDHGGRIYYRLKDSSVLSSKLGLTKNFSYEPVMAEQFFLEFSNEDEATQAKEVLEGFMTGDAPTFYIQPQGSKILVQCQQTNYVSSDTMIKSPTSEHSFFDIFYRVDGAKSGFHHPDGILWIKRPGWGHEEFHDKVVLRDIAPTILDILDTPKPDFMKGTSLFSQNQSTLKTA